MDSATQKIPADPDPLVSIVQGGCRTVKKKPNKVHSPVVIITFGEIAVTTYKKYIKTESV